MNKIDFHTWMQAHELLQCYADAVDRADVATVISLFAADAQWEYSPALILRGRDAIAEYCWNGIRAFKRTSHHVGAPVLLAQHADGSVDSRAYMVAEHLMNDGSTYTVHGRYVDRLVPVGSALLIGQRKVVVHIARGTDRVYNMLERVQHAPQPASA